MRLAGVDGSGERCGVVADEGGEEGGGFALAGIGGDEVVSVGGFVEAVTGTIDRDGAGMSGVGVLHLHAHGTFENVADDGAGMAMGLRGLAGSVAHANDVNAQVIRFESGEGMREDGSCLHRRLLWGDGSLRCRGDDGQRCVADDCEDVAPAFHEGHDRLSFEFKGKGKEDRLDRSI